MDDPSVLCPAPAAFRRAAAIGAALVLASGLLVLIGWGLDVSRLKGLAFDISMKPNAALAFVLSGGGLLLLLDPQAGSRRRGFGRVCASMVMLMGGLTLVEHWAGVGLGIDQLLFHESPGARATAAPGRMGVQASLSFILGGVALWLLDFRTERGRYPSEWFALTIGFISLFPLVGYTYRAEEFFTIIGLTAIALNTAIAFFLLAMSLLLARPGRGLMAVLRDRGPGGLMARRLLLAAVLAPFIGGWLRVVSERQGWLSGPAGTALFALSMIAVFSYLILGNARSLNAIERTRRAAEEQRNALLASEQMARGEAERANRLKDEFLATVSHELRTPLNAILGWAQLLNGSDCEKEELAQGLATIERNARAQAHLVEDLLDMSRILSGNLRLQMETVELPLVLSAALDTLRPAAEAKGVRLRGEWDHDLPPLRGDANRLQQVLWNLLSNAVKFTPPGGRVDLSLKCSNGQAVIRVADSGQGIDGEFLPQLFQNFRQADGSSTRRQGGLGLGLAIVRNIVEMHGGTVGAASPGPGRGATFTVCLPLRGTATPPTLAPASPRVLPAEVKGALRGVRVLVVDDQADARRLVQRLLEQYQAEVQTAGTVAEAWQSLADFRPDVLISDISMPEEDGYSLIRKVREHDREVGGQTQAIALTAYARFEDRAKALNSGFQLHLSKPIQPAQLIKAIAKLAGRSEVGR